MADIASDSRNNLMDIMKCLFFIVFTLLFTGCSQQIASVPQKTLDLPAVQINGRSGRFFIPGCERYNQVPEQALLTLPSVQEAKLSGYTAAAGCPADLINSRIQQEKELIGEIKPTKETEERKARVLMQRELREVNDKLE